MKTKVLYQIKRYRIKPEKVWKGVLYKKINVNIFFFKYSTNSLCFQQLMPNYTKF